MESWFKQIAKELKSHPHTLLAIAMLIGFALYSYNYHAKADDLNDVKQSVATQAKVNECRWLSDKIERLEATVYTLKRDKADPKWIEEKESALQKVVRRYQVSTCSITGY